MTEQIVILLPVHNRREVTRRFVECLKPQTHQNYHLLLIDDGSTDGTEEMVREQIQSLSVIKGEGNWWWAGSLRQGYEWLKSQNLPSSNVVLIINDDTEFEADFLERGLAIIERNKRTLLQAQCYSRQTNLLIDAGVHVDWRRLTFKQAVTPEEINCLSTRGLFLRLGDFYGIGGFYPRLLPHYGSDYEFTMRAHRKGLKLMTDQMLKLRVDEDTAGHHELGKISFFASLRKLFSRKMVMNPVYWSSFIWLACPWRWKLLNLLKIWGFMFVQIYRSLNIKSRN